MFFRMRIRSATVATWALTALVACQAAPSTPPPRVVSPASMESAPRATAAAPAPWPPPVALTRGEYDKRLSEASFRCEEFDLGELEGRYVVADSRPYPGVGEVWMCDGHIRWRLETGQISDICLSRTAQVPGGLNAEGTWHEDFHDLGDASGLYVRLREFDQRLLVDVSAWDDSPAEFSPFFSLARLDSAKGREHCPFE